jgi:competence protein ComEC
MATLGLIYISPIFQKRLQNFRFPQNLKEVFYLTFSAQIATLPLIIYHFGRLSLVALPANLAILLVIPLTMIFGFLAGGVGLISVFFGKIAGSVVFILLAYEMAVINFFAKIPFAAVSVFSFSFIWVVIIYTVLTAWIFYQTKRAKSAI